MVSWSCFCLLGSPNHVPTCVTHESPPPPTFQTQPKIIEANEGEERMGALKMINPKGKVQRCAIIHAMNFISGKWEREREREKKKKKNPNPTQNQSRKIK